MEFLKLTNDAGVEVEIPHDKIVCIMKPPMQQNYVLQLRGAVMKVDGLKCPLATVINELEASETIFDLFPIPEGTDALVNPAHVMFITSNELTLTTIMFCGGGKVVVSEGINTVRNKLCGLPIDA